MSEMLRCGHGRTWAETCEPCNEVWRAECVERLTYQAQKWGFRLISAESSTRLTPAEADALRAENARLREALKIVAAGVDTFCINPEGGPDIVVEGGSRFAHEEDVLPLIYAARAALAGEVQK